MNKEEKPYTNREQETVIMFRFLKLNALVKLTFLLFDFVFIHSAKGNTFFYFDFMWCLLQKMYFCSKKKNNNNNNNNTNCL